MATTEIRDASVLIAKYIEPHPAKPGRAFARVKEYGIPVWALIGFLAEDFSDADQVAHDYMKRAQTSFYCTAKPLLHA